jgi:hypothetical protein
MSKISDHMSDAHARAEAMRRTIISIMRDQGFDAEEMVLIIAAVAGCVVSAHEHPDVAYMNFMRQMAVSAEQIGEAIGRPFKLQVMEIIKGGKR